MPNYTRDDLKISAGNTGAMVERKSLEDSLAEYGFSMKDMLNTVISKESSYPAKLYAAGLRRKKIEGWRESDAELYLVKKVFCSCDEYERIDKAVSSKDTNKFKVLLAVSANPNLIGYKSTRHGIEEYLLFAKSSFAAISESTEFDRMLFINWDQLDNEMLSKVKMMDRALSSAIYKHTPKAFEEFYKKFELKF